MLPVRCEHCGLQHDGQVVICPITGLRIEAHAQRAARRRACACRVPDPSPEAMLGTTIGGRYRITQVIGRGGMSAIYEAADLPARRTVALKVLHPGLAQDEEAIARLRREAEVVAAIGHANICRIFDVGFTATGSPYLVLERLAGESLADRIALFGPMSFAELAPLVVQVLAALQATHRAGIVHRDLKPDNVFVVKAGARSQPLAKLLDFGISKSVAFAMDDHERLTHTGMVMGTPYYMAPEQARGDSTLDHRVDLWAVGVILYEALSGRRPFVATNYNALLVKILTSRPRRLDRIVTTIAPPVVALVERAMAKLREDRFQDAEQFAAAVGQLRQRLAPEDLHAPTLALRRPAMLPALGSVGPEARIGRATDPAWSAESRGPGGSSAAPTTRPDPAAAGPLPPAAAAGPTQRTLPDRPTEVDAEQAAEDEPEEIAAYAYFHATGGPSRAATTERTEVMVGWEEDPEPPEESVTDPISATLADSVSLSDTDVMTGRQVSDDEPTTVYDVEAARAKLAARRARGARSPADEPEPDAHGGRRNE